MKTRALLQLLAVLFIAVEFSALTFLSIEKVQSLGNTYYVSPSGSNSNPGTLADPFLTIQYALNNAVEEGDTLLIRGGTYTLSSNINFPTSGTALNPIIVEAYPGETPDINGNNVATNILNIENQSYITIRGLSIRNPEDIWANIVESDHITMEDMTFDNDSQAEIRNFAGVYIRYSDYVTLRDSNLTDWGTTTVDPEWGERGNDDGNLVRVVGNIAGGGMYNLLEDNYFGNGAQGSVLVNSPYTVVRNNTFENEWQKGLYVGWFNEPGNEPPGTIWEAVGTLVEDNQFIRSQEADSWHGGLGIEHTAIQSIIRGNVIRNSDQIGFITTVFCDNTGNSSCNYANTDYDNRIYNNTIVNNGLDAEEGGGASIAFGGTGMELTNHGLIGIDNTFRDSVFKNNFIYGNLDNANNDPLQLNMWVSGGHNNPPYGGHIIAGNLFHNKVSGLCSPGNNRCPVYIPGSGTHNAASLNSASPSNFFDNIEITDSADPGFVTYDAVGNNFDLHLEADSPAVDAGTDLTEATNSGSSSNTLIVDDSYYFHDGYTGIIAADVIQIGSQTATITNIDYGTHTITLSANLTWTAGDPVNLAHDGAAPDIGAFEFASGPVDTDPPIVGPITFDPFYDGGSTDYAAQNSTYESTITDSASSIASCEQQINSGGWISATWTPDGGDPTTGVCSGVFGLSAGDDNDPFTVQMRATDSESNVGTGSVTNITIDSLNPASAATIANATYDSENFLSTTINGTSSDSASGVQSVTITIQRSSDSNYWNGTTWQVGASNLAVSTSNGYSTWTYGGIAAGNLTVGVSYTIVPRATDRIDHVVNGTSDSFAWTEASPEPDNPIVSILSFDPVANVSGTNYIRENSEVSATITDPTSDIDNCEYSTNSGSSWAAATWTPDGGDATTGTCSFTFAFGGGTHGNVIGVNMRGYDILANVGTGSNTNVTIDTSNPAAAVTIAAADYNPSSFNTTTINGTSSDTGSGVQNVTITIQRSTDSNYWNGTTWQVGASNLSTVTSNGYAAWTYGGITSSNLTDGATYTVVATATDRLGHTATSTSDSFEWDSTVPDADNPSVGSISFTNSHVVGSTTHIRENSAASAVITDATSNISGCDYTTNNGSAWTAATWTADLANPRTGTCSYTFALTGSSHGTAYQFNFRGTDLASNIGDGTMRNIVIDATSPSATVLIANGNYSNKTFTTSTIAGTASDTGTGVASVAVTIQRSGDNFFWNGASWVAASASVLASTSNGYATWNYSGIPASQFTNSYTYNVRAIAADYVGHSTTSASDTFSWTTDTVPVVTITANPGLVVPEDTSVVLTAVVTGGEAPYTYSWSGVCSGNISQSTINLSQGQYTCTVKVLDAQNDEGTKSAQVTFASGDVPEEDEEDPDTGVTPPTTVPPVSTGDEEEINAGSPIGGQAIALMVACLTLGSLGGLVYLLLGKKGTQATSESIMDAFK